MMYLVRHYHFGRNYHFATLAEAKAFALKANFDAIVWRGQRHVANYNSTSGWRHVPLLGLKGPAVAGPFEVAEKSNGEPTMRVPRYTKLIQLPDGTWAYPLFHENRRVNSGGLIEDDAFEPEVTVRSEAA
jgi:hypothetical protein